MSAITVKNAILAALTTPKGHAEVSKAEAQAIAKAALTESSGKPHVTADEARLIGKLLNQDSFETGQKYTLTAPARTVLDSFASAQHLPYGANAGAMAGQIRGQLDAATLPAPLTKAPSTGNLLPLPLGTGALGQPTREAYVDPSSGQFFLKQGSGASAQWFGPMAVPGSDAHAEQNATLQATLMTASQGLDYMSESDYPVDPVLFAGAGKTIPTTDDMAKILNLPAGTTVQSESLDQFFNPITNIDPNDPEFDDGQKAQALKFANLRSVLEQNLTDLQVIRTGDIRIGVYIVGRNASGDLVGVHTTSIET